MRFISRSQSFKKGVINAEHTLVQTPRGPEQVESRAPYIALFSQGGVTPNEVDLALERFQFKGLSERENPARRISVYDTDERAHLEGWTPEFKAEVEQALLKGQNADYFLVEQPKVAIPWNAYDTADVEDIVPTAKLIGVSLDHVLAYERENGNRPEVIAELEADSAEVEISA